MPTRLRKKGVHPLASSSGVSDFIDQFKVAGPSVFTGRSGSVGNTFYVEDDYWPLNTTLYVKDFHGNDPRYCYWLLKSIDLTKFAGGTGVPTLNRNIVHEHEVAVADKTTQSAIAHKIDNAMNSGKILLEKYQAKLKILASLRQSLLAEAFVA